MKSTIGLIMVYLLFLIPLTAVGQDGEFDPPTIVPPSPTAYELGKYGMVDVGMFTGTPNISVPLYTYTAGNLSVPIGLSYNSNGVKVDQMTSNVGLGWSLNAGGVVTRIVRGKEDENYPALFPEEDIADYGTRSPMAVDFFYAAGNHTVDTEPDLYAYNFNGYSGKFAFTKEKGIIQMPKKDLEISSYVDENDNAGFLIIDPSGIKYFFMEVGTSKNRLSDNPPDPPVTTSWFLSKIAHPYGDEIDFVYTSSSYTYIIGQSQSLKAPSPHVQAKACSGSWTSKWDQIESDTISNRLTVVDKKLTQIKSNNPIHGKVDFLNNTQHPSVSSYNLVSQIKVKDEGQNEIEEFNFNYLFTNNDRVFLDKISFKNHTKKYTFTYNNPDLLPERLSFSQDHWGFYNGITNYKLYPNPQTLDDFNINSNLRDYNQGADKSVDTVKTQYGLLAKIEYPTRGYNEFEYEPNSYYGIKKVYPATTTVNLSVATDDDTFSAEDSITLTDIQADQEIDLYSFIGFNNVSGCDESTYPSHHIKASIYVTDLSNTSANTLYYFTTDPIGNSMNIDPDENNDNIVMKLLANHDYEIKIKVVKSCLQASMNFSYFPGTVQEVPDNIVVGGSRVKRIKKYDPSNNKTEQDTYYYGKKESINESSGQKGLTPFYVSNIKSAFSCNGGQYFTNYLSLNSSSIRTLYNSSSGMTTYRYVTVSKGGDDFETGGEEHEFIIGNDYPGNPLWGEYSQSAPWTNFGWDNGLTKVVTQFKKSGSSIIPVSQTENVYNQDNRNYQELLSYSVRKQYDLLFPQNAVYTCTSKDIQGGSNSMVKYYVCLEDHSHAWRYNYSLYSLRQWINPSWPGGAYLCGKLDADNVERIHYHECYNEQVDSTVVYLDQIKNLDITEYKNISYWHYLDSTTTKQYDVNGLNPVTTASKYIYDNASHLQLTRTQTSDSDGNILETKMYYPGDVSGTGDLPGGSISTLQLKAIDTLKLHHRINIPLQTEITNNGSMYRKRSLYKDWGDKYGSVEHLIAPELVQSSKGTGALKDRVTYHDYNSYGQPIEVSKTDGTHVYYVWGYDHSRPIAKIENVGTISSAQQNLINDAVSTSNSETSSGTENTLRTKLESLRQGFPDAMVTTYTYDPLIGITSVIDPSGYTSYYTYDEFNRLEFIKDKDDKVLEQYRYIYALDELVVNTTASTTSTTVGSNVSFTANTTGGSGDFTYEWTVPGVSGLGNTATINVTTLSSHTPNFTATCKVTDNHSLESVTVNKQVTVTQSYPALSVGIISYTGSKSVGSNLSYSISVSGGSGSYTYEWKKTNDQSTTVIGSNSSSISNQIGSQDCEEFTISCKVTDNNTNEVITKTKIVPVISGCSGGGPGRP